MKGFEFAKQFDTIEEKRSKLGKHYGEVSQMLQRGS